jgi:hypothetical protein
MGEVRKVPKKCHVLFEWTLKGREQAFGKKLIKKVNVRKSAFLAKKREEKRKTVFSQKNDFTEKITVNTITNKLI